MIYPCPKCNQSAVCNEQGVAQTERDVTLANKKTSKAVDVMVVAEDNTISRDSISSSGSLNSIKDTGSSMVPVD